MNDIQLEFVQELILDKIEIMIDDPTGYFGYDNKSSIKEHLQMLVDLCYEMGMIDNPSFEEMLAEAGATEYESNRLRRLYLESFRFDDL